MTQTPIQYGPLTATPIREGFGAEVRGVDFSKTLPQAVVDEVRNLRLSRYVTNHLRTSQMVKIQDKYAVTVYRDTGEPSSLGRVPLPTD